MNFARAKTILIFIFIFVNIFLLLIYNLFILDEKKIDNETLFQVLLNNNVVVNEGIIKEQKKVLPGVEVINLVNDSDKLALSFLGKEYKKESDTLYKTQKASLSISKQLIEFNILNPSDKKYNDISILNAGNKIINTLSKYGMDKSNISVYNAGEGSKDDFYIEVAYNYGDTPVFNHSLYAVADKKGLKSLKGTVISFNEIKNQQYNIITVSDVLLDFIDNIDVKNADGKTVITDVKLGYYFSVNELEVSTYAIPAYEIKLENGKLYYYDAREYVDASFKFLGSKSK